MWLTSVTVWLFCREGVAKSPCRCGSVFEIYTFQIRSAIDSLNVHVDELNYIGQYMLKHAPLTRVKILDSHLGKFLRVLGY